MTDVDFEAVVLEGTFFMPAQKAYAWRFQVVACDRCKKKPLTCCVNKVNVDLCMSCVDDLGERMSGSEYPKSFVGKRLKEVQDQHPRREIRAVGRLLPDGTKADFMVLEDFCSTRVNVVVDEADFIVEFVDLG